MKMWTPFVLLALMYSVSFGQWQSYIPSFRSYSETENTPTKEKSDFLLWFTAGVGVTGPGIGGVLKGTYVWKEHSISAKVHGGGSISIFGENVDDVVEYSVYYGKQMITFWTLVRIAAGPAYFVRNKDGSSFNRLGLGGEVEAMFKAGPVGVSIMPSIMLAKDIVFGSFTVNLSIGKLYY